MARAACRVNADWRDNLPTAELMGLRHRGGGNRVNELLVLAFREDDEGREDGLWKEVGNRRIDHVRRLPLGRMIVIEDRRLPPRRSERA